MSRILLAQGLVQMREVMFGNWAETSQAVNVVAELLIRSIAAIEKLYLPEYLATVMSRERMTGCTELHLTWHQTVLYIRTLASGQRPLLYDGSSRRYGGSRAERLIRAGVVLE